MSLSVRYRSVAAVTVSSVPMPKPGLLTLKPGVWCTRPHALPLHTHTPISLPAHYTGLSSAVTSLYGTSFTSL